MTVQDWPTTSLYPGYLIDDQGLWRSIRCTTCGKPTGFVADQLTDQRTLRLVHSHRCGPIGTGWEEAGSPGPGPAHARLLRSVTADVYQAGFQLYADDQDVADAAHELVEALLSHLHGAFDKAAYGPLFHDPALTIVPTVPADQLERIHAAEAAAEVAPEVAPDDGGEAA